MKIELLLAKLIKIISYCKNYYDDASNVKEKKKVSYEKSACINEPLLFCV